MTRPPLPRPGQHWKDTNAGRAEENEVIKITAPEGHLLQGFVEVCWWRDGTFTVEFECAGTAAPTIRPFKIEFDTETFELGLEPGE